MTKLKKSNCDKTQNNKLWQILKTKIVTKLKNSKCDQTQKIKMWQKSKSQNLTKLENSKCDKTLKLKMWQNSKTQNVTKLNNQNYKKLILAKSFLVITTWHLDYRWNVFEAAFCDLAMFFLSVLINKNLNYYKINRKHCEIARGCPEYISSVVEVSSSSYQKTFFMFWNWVLS